MLCSRAFGPVARLSSPTPPSSAAPRHAAPRRANRLASHPCLPHDRSKQLVAVVHFEPSSLGEQLALAAYSGLNGKECCLKSDDEKSTLVLFRCMPKTKGKARGSLKGQTTPVQAVSWGGG